MSTLAEPQLLKIDKTKILKLAAQIHRQIQKDTAEWEQDRRRNGWTSRNPYCKHGTYIGDPYGADHLCMACEMGYSELEMALGSARSEVWRAQRKHRDLLKRLVTYNAMIEAILARNGYLELGYLLGYQDTVKEILEIEERWT